MRRGGKEIPACFDTETAEKFTAADANAYAKTCVRRRGEEAETSDVLSISARFLSLPKRPSFKVYDMF